MNVLKIKTKIRRMLNGFFHFEHFSSAPFLSGDTFRSICNHAFDEFSDVVPSTVRPGEIIFVKNNFLHDFFKHIHPYITVPYILLHHNDDTTVDDSYTRYIDNNIIHWYGLNIDTKHPKMTPIPIGIENIGYRNKANMSYFLNPIYKTSIKKQSMLVAFNTAGVHPERIDAFKYAQASPCADIQNVKSTQEEYIRTLSSYTHVVSPRGAGIDCHRTWEALYMNVIPLVKRSPNTSYFESIEVPLHVVETWEEIQHIADVGQISSTNSNISSHPALYIQYWIDMIHERRKAFFKGDCTF